MTTVLDAKVSIKVGKIKKFEPCKALNSIKKQNTLFFKVFHVRPKCEYSLRAFKLAKRKKNQR